MRSIATIVLPQHDAPRERTPPPPRSASRERAGVGPSSVRWLRAPCGARSERGCCDCARLSARRCSDRAAGTSERRNRSRRARRAKRSFALAPAFGPTLWARSRDRGRRLRRLGSRHRAHLDSCRERLPSGPPICAYLGDRSLHAPHRIDRVAVHGADHSAINSTVSRCGIGVKSSHWPHAIGLHEFLRDDRAAAIEHAAHCLADRRPDRLGHVVPAVAEARDEVDGDSLIMPAGGRPALALGQADPCNVADAGDRIDRRVEYLLHTSSVEITDLGHGLHRGEGDPDGLVPRPREVRADGTASSR